MFLNQNSLRAAGRRRDPSPENSAKQHQLKTTDTRLGLARTHEILLRCCLPFPPHRFPLSQDEEDSASSEKGAPDEAAADNDNTNSGSGGGLLGGTGLSSDSDDDEASGVSGRLLPSHFSPRVLHVLSLA